MRIIFSVLVVLLGAAFIGVSYVAKFYPNPYVGPGAVLDTDFLGTNITRDYVYVATGVLLSLFGLFGRPIAAFVIASFGFAVLALAGYLSPGDVIFGVLPVSDFERQMLVVTAVAFVLLTVLAMRLIPEEKRA